MNFNLEFTPGFDPRFFFSSWISGQQRCPVIHAVWRVRSDRLITHMAGKLKTRA